ncbi:MAG: SH3 domain-containing protein [Leptospira sp.]|nr:SH3 domain-containing protein [Leptospira sp.]
MSFYTKTVSYLFVLFCSPGLLIAQGHWGDYIPVKEVKSTYRIFGDKVNLREDANTKSKIVTSLKAGDKVQILEKANILFEQNQLKENWYKVKTNGGTIGYLWGGLIADYSFTDSNYEILCKNLGPKLTGLELRVLSKDKIISSLKIEDGPVSNEGWGYKKLKEKDFSPSPQSLFSLKYFVFSEIEYGYNQQIIISLSKDGTLTNHFSWLEGSCDPPACMESWLVFPSETLKKDDSIKRVETKGQKNTIIEISRSYDIDDPKSNDYFKKLHIWNGKTFQTKEE